jgi:regulator of nucleoside diphosphate kinase
MGTNPTKPGATKAGSRKPPIHMLEADYDRIANLAMSMENTNPKLADAIFTEIDRAHLHTEKSMPKNVVGLGSVVEFIEVATEKSRTLQLVLPGDADIDAGKMSVMTSVGAALIGMSVGRDINWPLPDGRPRTFRIISVDQRR